MTGAAGFIGSKLVAELVKQQHKVYALIEKDDSMSRERLHAIDSNIEIIDDLQYMLRNASAYPAFDRIFHQTYIYNIRRKHNVKKHTVND